VDIENPAGILSTVVQAETSKGELLIRSAAYQRSTQVLVAGYVPLYNASAALVAALEELAAGR
jgi:hypothetical protein